MKLLFTILPILFFSVCHCQNLVPNPSFEDTVNCPEGFSEINLSIGWNSYRPNPDYYNTCSTSLASSVPQNALGMQRAASGNAYAGLYAYAAFAGPNSREFIGRQLSSALIIGKKYYVMMKVSLADSSNCGINNLGALFSTISYNDSMPAPIHNRAHVYSHFIISDTETWVTISGSFIADSSYEYIIIGNFFQDSMTDTIGVSGGSSYLWGNTRNAYYYIDDVCVSSDSLTCILNDNTSNYSTNDNIYIYPNPGSNKIYFSDKNYTLVEFSIYNLVGEKIKMTLSRQENSIDVSNLPNGIYLIEIKYNDRVFYKKQIINH